MRATFLLTVIVWLIGCSTFQAKKNSLKEALPSSRESLKFEVETRINQLKEGFRHFKNERVAIINIHDYPDSGLISAKSKINPPDLTLEEVRRIQVERAEILRQALEAHCDNCENIEILSPIEVFTERQLNFFFDKIFLKQEVTSGEFQTLRKDLAKYSVVILVLSSENYEKNRGYNKEEQIVSQSEAELKAEAYIYHLNSNETIFRSHLKMVDYDYIFYQKAKDNDKGSAERIKHVSDTSIIKFLNDVKYDGAYPYPLSEESFTLFYYFYNNLIKTIFEGE